MQKINICVENQKIILNDNLFFFIGKVDDKIILDFTDEHLISKIKWYFFIHGIKFDNYREIIVIEIEDNLQFIEDTINNFVNNYLTFKKNYENL